MKEAKFEIRSMKFESNSEPRMEHGMNTDGNPCLIRVPSVAPDLFRISDFAGSTQSPPLQFFGDLTLTCEGRIIRPVPEVSRRASDCLGVDR